MKGHLQSFKYGKNYLKKIKTGLELNGSGYEFPNLSYDLESNVLLKEKRDLGRRGFKEFLLKKLSNL